MAQFAALKCSLAPQAAIRLTARWQARTVPISNRLVARLKAWRLKSKFKKPDDLIFPNDKGNHIGHDNLIKRRFVPLFDKLDAAHRTDPANVPSSPRRFNWHALMLDRSGVRAKNRANIRRARITASDYGPLWASISERGSQQENGSDIQRSVRGIMYSRRCCLAHQWHMVTNNLFGNNGLGSVKVTLIT